MTTEGEGWKRVSGVVGSAATFSIREKFQAVLKHFQFDEQWRKEMEHSFKTWHEVRQHLFHYKDRTSQSEDDLKKAILDQCQIAGAINVLILKLIGYSGLMRANTFWDGYR
jgi:restriction endonuclease Mrr